MEIQFNEETGGWITVADDMDVLGVEVTPLDEGSAEWQVTVYAMEHVREEPLESRLRAAIAGALEALPDVKEQFEEDREVWVVTGPTSGRSVAEAVGVVVERHEAAIAEAVGNS